MASDSPVISDSSAIPKPDLASGQADVVMPRATIAPLTLSLALAMLAMGVITSPAFLVVGAVIMIAAIGMWISSLLPGRGHFHEPFVPSRNAPELSCRSLRQWNI